MLRLGLRPNKGLTLRMWLVPWDLLVADVALDGAGCAAVYWAVLVAWG